MFLGLGCDGGHSHHSPDPVAKACAEPQRGNRFAVCGQLTTSVGAAQGTAWVIDGSADSRNTQAAGARFQVEGGTFHAGR
ncbi:hypothetical protein AKJ08_2358 [Vulgatibacter incomptus]|uniref:Uncharacterized protein n=1 Tax=Vulgatibacter incomptus TaxID=1391653 RepID=A0A0K1PEX8_9BACT|nr:hypothetical protein AKJ08_2358 [Vulgatibacter incomptus]